MFNCNLEQAGMLGFIHEILGHVIHDMDIGSNGKKTNIMEVERVIRSELGWKGVSRKLKEENADLSGIPAYNLENLK
jgi:hypothetical protein